MYQRSGLTTFEVTVPVLQVSVADWRAIGPLLEANLGILNATINDFGVNVWKDYYDSTRIDVSCMQDD